MVLTFIGTADLTGAEFILSGTPCCKDCILSTVTPVALHIGDLGDKVGQVPGDAEMVELGRRGDDAVTIPSIKV